MFHSYTARPKTLSIVAAVTVLIDPPAWPAHGRLWSHLVSDVSLGELHEFASRLGIPRRGFDLDHYDVPSDRYDGIVLAGAEPVTGKDLLRRLVGSEMCIRDRVHVVGDRHRDVLHT